MNRTLIPTFQIVIVLAVVLPCFGQSKPTIEVDAAKCWSYSTGDAAADTVAAGNPHYLLGFSGAKVEAVALDGKKSWSTELGGDIRSNILPTENGVFVVTSTADSGSHAVDASLRLLSGDTGITVRSQKLGAAERYFLFSLSGSLVVVSGSGSIELFGPDNSSVWKREIAGGFVGEPVLTGMKLTVAATSNQIFTVSLQNGEIESMRKMPFAVTAVGRTQDGDLLVGDERGNAALFKNDAEKAYWKFKSGGAISKLAEAGGNILAVSNDNFVYLLDDRNGSLVWKKRLPGRIAAAAAFDRYVFISGFEQHSVLIADIQTGKIAGQIKLADDESVTALRTTPRYLLALTTAGLYSYSLDGCGQK